MVTMVGTETDLVETLCNLVQLDLDAMEAYDLAVARVENAEYRDQLEAFKGDHIRHSEELSNVVTELGGKPSTGPGTKQNMTTGGAVLADMVGDDRLMMGSDYPFDMAERDPVGTVNAAVAPAHRQAVLGGTAQRLLCLSPACGCGGRPLRPLAAEAV